MSKRAHDAESNQEAASGQVPPKRQKDNIDISSAIAGVHQGGGALKAEIEDLRLQEFGTMFDKLGTSRGRVAPSTHRYVLDRQIKPTFLRLLRLCYRYAISFHV